jgi:hypothetical protein
VSLVLDAGALVAFEKGNRVVRAFLERAARDGVAVRTSTAVVAQVWRGGARQTDLARLLRGVDEVELTRERARSGGKLLGSAGTADVVDGALVDVAVDGDEILTSDPDDIAHLAEKAKKTIIITRVG